MGWNRRKHRSSDPRVATRHYLQSLARREAYEAVALSDCCGQLLVGVGAGVDLQGVAAAAPLAHTRPEWITEDLRRRVTAGRPLRAFSVTVGRDSFYVAVVGGRDRRPWDVRETFCRIFGGGRPVVATA